VRIGRIGIDARKLHDFGIGTYIRNLLRHLARLDRQTDFVLFCRPEDCETLAEVGENFRPIPETAGNYSVASNGRVSANIPSLSSNLVFYMVSNSLAYTLQNDSATQISGNIALQVSP